MPKKPIALADIKTSAIADTKKFHAKEITTIMRAKDAKRMLDVMPCAASRKTLALVTRFNKQEDCK